ncbi:hypothetical protein LAM01_07630 [Amylolactobacillus amylophilus]|nr:hypothetical protein LAM01_07630 [Amylolactobacillus amylophilus]
MVGDYIWANNMGCEGRRGITSKIILFDVTRTFPVPKCRPNSTGCP